MAYSFLNYDWDGRTQSNGVLALGIRKQVKKA